MLYPDMRPMDKIPSGGGAPKPKPSSYLPTYITVYINTPNPPTSAPADTQRHWRNCATRAKRSEHCLCRSPERARIARRDRLSRDSKSDAIQARLFAPDMEEESETAGVNLGNVTSHEDLFLSLDAVDLSYYFSMQEYELVREVATCLRNEKLIHFFLDDPRACLKALPHLRLG